MSSPTIDFTPELARLFHDAYDRAIQHRRTEFVFQDRLFDVNYAFYLIMHLERVFNVKQ